MYLKKIIRIKESKFIDFLLFLWFISDKKLKFNLFYVLISSLIAAILEFTTLLTAKKFLEVITIITNSTKNNVFLDPGLSDSNNLFKITIIFLFLIIFSGTFRLISLRLSVFITAKYGNLLFKLSYRNILNNSFYINSGLPVGSIIAGITKELDDSVQYVVRPIINIITCSIISIFIFCGIITSANKYVFLLITIIVSLYFIYSLKLRKRLANNSLSRSSYVKKLGIFLNDTLNSLDELLLIISKNKIIKKAYKLDYEIRNLSAQSGYIQESPRYVIETILFASITLLTIISFIFLENKASIIASLGAMLLGLQKLLPVIQNIFGSYAAIKSNADSFTTIKKFVETKSSLFLEKRLPISPISNWDLKLQEIYYTYTKNEFASQIDPISNNNYIFENFSLEIKKGDKMIIKGASGKGKSTLLRIISTLKKPTSGKVIFNGKNVWDDIKSLQMLRSQISYLPQKANVFSGSIIYNVTLEEDTKKINYEKAFKCLSDVFLLDYVEALKNKENTLIKSSTPPTLSGGQSQRLALARALYRDTEILIIDEATSSLDKNNEKSIISKITSIKQLTIICSSHSNIDHYFSKVIDLN
tara:strand:+ start:19 stop:1785 length:1767 start_codon:yes stop_codon:yes gene_type:complete